MLVVIVQQQVSEILMYLSCYRPTITTKILSLRNFPANFQQGDTTDLQDLSFFTCFLRKSVTTEIFVAIILLLSRNLYSYYLSLDSQLLGILRMSRTYINHQAEISFREGWGLGGLKRALAQTEFRNREKRTEIRSNISLLDKILKFKNGYATYISKVLQFRHSFAVVVFFFRILKVGIIWNLESGPCSPTQN